MTLDDKIEYFEYLDQLRNSGAVNMFGARPYLIREFGLDKSEAAEVCNAWRDTFDPEKTAKERAAA